MIRTDKTSLKSPNLKPAFNLFVTFENQNRINHDIQEN